MLRSKGYQLVKVNLTRSNSTFSYKDLPKDTQKLVDRVIRVDHAGNLAYFKF